MEICKELVKIDKDYVFVDTKETEERFNELYSIARACYPEVADYFIHVIANEQVLYENGYEDQELADKLYQQAQEEIKQTEYYFNVEKYLSE